MKLVTLAALAILTVGAPNALADPPVTSVKTVPVRSEQMPIKRLSESERSRVPPVVDEIGSIPNAWRGAWCVVTEGEGASTMPDTAVYHRTKGRETCGDGVLIVGDGGNQEYWESGCTLIDGFWNDKAQTYSGVYDCGGEGERWFTRATFSSPRNRGGMLVVRDEGRLDAPSNEAPFDPMKTN
jgi:hypothetical protein